MLTYIIKKFWILLLSLFLVATLTFFLMHAIPGDPFTQDKAIPEEIMAALKKHYGLDRPLWVQYLSYLKGIVTFDLGPSFKYEGRTVSEIIMQGFPISLELGAEAIFLAIGLGISLGTLAAFNHLRWQDQFVMFFAVLGVSLPSFIVATALQYVFSMKLELLPVARWGSFTHSILPAVSLSLLPAAFIARLTRSNMVEILQQDYILTARSKGLAPFRIAVVHVLRNALLPVISFLGPLAAAVLTGSFVVEKIFGIPGLGGWFVMSVVNRDYTVIMGTTLFYSACLMVCVLVVDILYCLIDPRIKLNERVAET